MRYYGILENGQYVEVDCETQRQAKTIMMCKHFLWIDFLDETNFDCIDFPKGCAKKFRVPQIKFHGH